MKKLLTLLLSLSLLLQAAPALAADGPYEGKTVILYTANIGGDLDVYPQIARVKKDYESQGADVILADVGNYLRGTPAANASRGEVVYTLMDAAGYDVAGMGLAEFSYTDAATGYPYHGNVTRYHTQAMLQDGCEEITYNVNKDGSQTAVLPARAPAKFQTVCSNVEPSGFYSFHRTAEVTTPSNFTVLFYGLADPAVAEQVQDGYVALREAVFEPDVFSVCLAGMDLSEVVGGEVFQQIIAVSPDSPATAGALVIDNVTQAVTVEDVPLRQSGENVDLSKVDESVYALAESLKYSGHSYFTSQVLLNGSDKANWNGETNLGDLVTDALKWYAMEYIDGMDKSLPVVAIQNGGNCDDFLYPGQVTDADLLKALPFSPMGIGVMEVTGQQLLETLEAASQAPDCPGFPQVSGLTYTLNLAEPYDGGAAYGKYFVADSVNRVTITGVNGEPFDPAATYNLVCDNFLINGNDTYYTLKNAKEAGAKYINNGPGIKVRDAVALYVINALDGYVTEAYAKPQGRINLQRFSDVPPEHWGLEAVNWAVEKGITQGTGEGHFSPDRTCTDPEICTFLWRAVGSPEPTGNIGDTYYYTKSTAWAAGEGITENQGDPDLPCTRATAVTYLWRVAGSPEVKGGNPFEDIPAGSRYERAVAWAVEQGITTGTGETTFFPDKVCTRAEIAAFLYRAAERGLLPTR